MKIVKKYYILLFILVMAVAAFNLFYHVWDQRVWDWDEARQSVSAYEMVKSGNYILTTYMNEPDYWNSKPPLAPWLMAVSYRLFGFNITAMRLPSIILSLGAVFLIMLMTRRRFSELTSLLSGFILGTSINFIFYHAGKSGDYEGGLIFLFTLAFFLIDYFRAKPLHYILAFFAAGLAFLQKSFAFIPVLMVIGAHFLIYKKYREMKIRHYALMLAALVFPIALWAVLRYQQDGLRFFQAMINNDLLSRTQNVVVNVGDRQQSVIYYINAIITGMMPWSIFLFLFPFYRNRVRLQPVTKGFPVVMQWSGFFKAHVYWLWIAGIFLLYGFAKTKLFWYVAPAIPAFAVYFGWNIADMLENPPMPNAFFRVFRKAMPVLLAVFIAVAEGEFLWPGRYSFPTDQDLLIKMPRNPGSSEVKFYFSDQLTQSRIFLVWVTRNYRPESLAFDKFLVQGKTGERIMIPAGQYKAGMTPGKNMVLVVSNRDWAVLEKK